MTDGLPDHALTLREAAAWLGVTYRWLSHQVATGKVPHTRMGKHPVFAPKHIEKILEVGIDTSTKPKPPQPSRRGGQRTKL